jgi:hypothetical protein
MNNATLNRTLENLMLNLSIDEADRFYNAVAKDRLQPDHIGDKKIPAYVAWIATFERSGMDSDDLDSCILAEAWGEGYDKKSLR